MKFFSITTLFIISILCTNNLHASYLFNINKKPDSQKSKWLLTDTTVDRDEAKRYLARVASYKNYTETVKKSVSTQVVAANGENNGAATVRVNPEVLTPEKLSENLFTAVQFDNPNYLQIQLLLKKDNSLINQVNDKGHTPLQMMVNGTTQLIISSQKGGSDLRKAVANRTEIIKLLVAHDANTHDLKDQVKNELAKTKKHTNPYRRLKRIKTALKNKKTVVKDEVDPFSIASITTTEQKLITNE